MTNKAVLQVVAVVIAIGAAFAAFNVMSKWDASPTSRANLVKIGDIQSVDGQVERRIAQSVETEAITASRPLYGQDLISTQKNATAVLALNTGTSVKLTENTRFVVELDATRPGGMIGTVLDGNVIVLSPGSQGSFRLFREGREVALDQPVKSGAPVIQAAPSIETEAGLTITATLPDESATPAPRAQPNAVSEEPVSNDVLTNEDIVRQLKSQTGFFQRCYLNYIHRTQSQASPQIGPGGTVVVGFTVQPTGRVNDAKIVKSDFKDSVLNNCLTEVIERTRFKGFRGEKSVPVLEFPISLN